MFFTARKATILAATAVIIAVFGSTPLGQAAGNLILPRNSVGATQLKKNAVSGLKVMDGTLSAADFKAGSLPAGPKGDAGPQGAQGPAGPKGAMGLVGPKGATGLVGPKGATGLAGPAGPSGVSGFQVVTATAGPPSRASTPSSASPVRAARRSWVAGSGSSSRRSRCWTRARTPMQRAGTGGSTTAAEATGP